MPSRTLLALAGWTAAAAAATLTGLAAVEIIGDGITGSSDGTTLSSEQVERQLDAAKASASSGPGGGSTTTTPSATPTTETTTPGPTSTPPSPSTSTTAPAATATEVRKTFSAPGGTAIATCEGTTVRLLSWAPAQGYGVKSADPGPDDEHAEVRFEGTAGKVELRVRCTDGHPTGSWKRDD
ncbi:hypothetical protein GCM10010372_02730 [Streptomyces tauricus]|uniref:septum formation initiator n=1 Tax=Streptomyces tauricus TaxID=68274 RepID=UPI001677E6C9|nr:septum formation initiator [Streptomyces tauricus]GHA07017.1 hypothetical protein GCM10010372_02730 [Streptomyces tauricus]